MTRIAPERWEDRRFKVLIAGGGVAALEGLLALRALAGNRVDIDLLAPRPEFEYTPLAVAEPFGRDGRTRFELARIAADNDADLLADSLAAVDPATHSAWTGSGAHLSYSALLVATGARPVPTLPGAFTYRGAGDNAALAAILDELIQGRAKRLVFAVPAGVRWPFPLYELALMTGAELASRGVEGAELLLITPEVEPLTLFGPRVSAKVRDLLRIAGVKVRTASIPASVEGDRLTLVGGSSIAADRVVALAALEPHPVPGIPRGPEGFVPTDAHMKVKGLSDVYAAGDATQFPIKQGGLAAQQADVAAAAIAAQAGAPASHEPFRPVLRAALLTGATPHYLRAEADGPPAHAAEAERPLWWPPGKVAGTHLAPYLAAGRRGERGERLADLEPLLGGDPEAEADHADAIGLALAAADADARWGDYDAALRWLDLAEELDFALPREYERKRRRWGAAEAA